MIENSAPQMNSVLERLERSNQRLVAATLAAALVAASGRPHSISEVMSIMRDLQLETNPQPGLGSYEAWKKEFDREKPYT